MDILNNQIHIYSLDTSCFYNHEELKLHNRLNKLYLYKKELKRKRDKYNKTYKNTYTNIGFEDYIGDRIHMVNKHIQMSKDKLYIEFKKNKEIRQLNKKTLIDKNIISVFESSLTRLLDIPTNYLSKDLFIVKAYFFDILEDIILNGFMFGDDKYIPLTASAGQIRTKKTVFIKESRFKEIESSLTCGLSIDLINSKGGVNVNKYLAYLALSNSATDEWKDFDITKAIVIDDMEFDVECEVDFIDDQDYSIKRQIMNILITHTDGCGMVLPKKSRKAFMCRLPWIKGLLEPFAFDTFIRQKSKELGSYCGKINDIYGKEYDILEDKIEIIFTKSQFKMWKYYNNWQHYQEKFLQHKCQAGICNMEEDEFSSAKLNYQMVQTLTDMTLAELKELSNNTVENIKKIGRDRRTMLKVLGVTKANTDKNNFQQALEIYPELLNDTYSKEILKQTKKSLVTEGRASKLDLGNTGYYTFISPDLYAFCEWTFLNDKNPKGLLNNGEVFCKLFKEEPELDCLRSPHLYREHAIRRNVVDKEKSKWFITNGLYTSCRDAISKILMFDVDGDKSLVSCHPTLLKVAKRNMKDIVPLYYNMRKADPQFIDKNTIYNGLKLAYTGGNIGIISNNITKIWNSDNPNLEAVKLLCMENNFTIDYAKTLYKPERPKDKNNLITNFTKSKVPHFFIYAKKKEKSQVDNINDSVINKLNKIIPNPNFNFKAMNLGTFNYKKLMRNKDITLNEMIIDKYTELDLKKRFMMNKDNTEEVQNLLYLYEEIKSEILKINNDIHYVVDVLVKYLYEYKKSNYKTTLWECFGDIIVENLKNNIKEGYILCEKCGVRIEETSNRKKYCSNCKEYEDREKTKIRVRKYRKNVTI